MYELGPEFGDRAVPPGTNLLVSGPPFSGVRRVGMEAVAQGSHHGDAGLVISARQSADEILAELQASPHVTEESPIGIVDCVSKRQGRELVEDPLIRYATAPSDLTGIGTAFAGLMKEFNTNGYDRVRVILDSYTLLLPYTTLQTLFEFGHVLTTRISTVDALGIHVIEASAHSTEAVETLAQLFDERIEVDNNQVVSSTLKGYSGEAPADSN